MAHSGGGLIDVATPAADTVLVTMSGAVVADASMAFDFDQHFEVSFDDPKVKKAKLTLEGRVIGLLRGERKGCAEYTDACASIVCAPVDLVSVCVPPHSACGCNSISVNDHDGPTAVPVVPCWLGGTFEVFPANRVLPRLLPIKLRIGKPQAITATARKLAILIYRALKGELVYRDPGADSYDVQQRTRVLRRLRQRAATLGFQLVNRETGEVLPAGVP